MLVRHGIAYIILFIVLSACAGSVPKSSVNETQVVADEVAQLAAHLEREAAVERSIPILAHWIESHSNLRMQASFPLPEVKFRTQAQLNALLFLFGSDTVGAYDTYNNILYLNENFSFSDEEIGNLMHEVVHWLMNYSGTNNQFECLEETDTVTYALEKVWDADLGTEFRLTPYQVSVYTTCTG